MGENGGRQLGYGVAAVRLRAVLRLSVVADTAFTSHYIEKLSPIIIHSIFFLSSKRRSSCSMVADFILHTNSLLYSFSYFFSALPTNVLCVCLI